MIVGTVCFSTDQGLGYLARDFYRHGIVTHPIILAHGRRQSHPEWYPPGTPFVHDYRHPDVINELAKCDCVLFFETPFDWTLIPRLRLRGVRTALMPMHECMPDPLPHIPDLILSPSELDHQWAVRAVGDRADLAMLTVPVEVPWRQRTKCEVFVHNAGNGGLRGRNGYMEVLEALRYIESDAKFIIRRQEPCTLSESYALKLLGPKRVTVVDGTVPFDQLWTEGDCLLFPEKFNGLSLPLQEARAAGMLVMATDRFPMNTWLPRSPLIYPTGHTLSRVSPRCAEFHEAIIQPEEIARSIDEWYGRDISVYSQDGRRWAEENSWAKLGPMYKEVLAP